MKRLNFKTSMGALALTLSLGWLVTVNASDDVDETRAVEGDGLVTVKIVRGQLEVIGWDQNEVRVVGTLDEALEEFIFETQGDHTHIEVKIEQSGSGSWYSRNEGSELTIYVPTDSELEFGGVSTDVSANKVSGDIKIGNVSGDIQVGPGRGEVDLSSVSGDINVKGRTGSLHANSVSGDVISEDNTGESDISSVSGDLDISNAGSDLELSTISGDIELVTSMLRAAEGQTVSGDIQITADAEGDGNIDLESISGSITLSLGGDIDGRFTLETGSGRISNQLTDDKPEVSKFMRDKNLRFDLGDGKLRVDMSSQSGDLTVERR